MGSYGNNRKISKTDAPRFTGYLGALKDDNEVRLYRPRLRKHCGSVPAVILFSQLIYWFSIYSTFYKFLDSCEHYNYLMMNKDGKKQQSWCEELGFSKAEFRTAFDKIGIRYKTKSAYNDADDKFQGKFFLSYHNKVTGLTWYEANDELLNQLSNTISIEAVNKIKETNL